MEIRPSLCEHARSSAAKVGDHTVLLRIFSLAARFWVTEEPRLDGFHLTRTCNQGQKSSERQKENEGGRLKTKGSLCVRTRVLFNAACVHERASERASEREQFTQLCELSSAIVYLSYLCLHDSNINQVLLANLYLPCLYVCLVFPYRGKSTAAREIRHSVKSVSSCLCVSKWMLADEIYFSPHCSH